MQESGYINILRVTFSHPFKFFISFSSPKHNKTNNTNKQLPTKKKPNREEKEKHKQQNI